MATELLWLQAPCLEARLLAFNKGICRPAGKEIEIGYYKENNLNTSIKSRAGFIAFLLHKYVYKHAICVHVCVIFSPK